MRSTLTSSEETARDKPIYARQWDRYVEKRFPEQQAEDDRLQWPGDEWGDPQEWENVFRNLFPFAGVKDWERAVEIGPGSGKYTLKVLNSSQATVRGYDISERFLEVCGQRCAEQLEEGRLSLHVHDGVRPDQILTDLTESGWRREIDAFYSIDAMVHVDLQYLIVYLLTAGLTLKPGGKLLLQLADVTTPMGFVKLMGDIRHYYPDQGNAVKPGKFEWMTPDMVKVVLTQLGFEIDLLRENRRDLFLVASLQSPQMSESKQHYIEPLKKG